MLNNDVKVGRLRRKPLRTVGTITLAVSVCIIVVWLTVVGGSNEPASNLATFVARRGPLTISVLESGTIQSREQIILRNEVEGRTSVVSIVPDGGSVKAGDLLVELDASTLKDAVIDQDIQVQRAEAAYVSAQENLAVVENQAVSDVNLAELTLEFAIQDLDQYKEGQFPNEETAAKNEITLAREELTRAEETLNWSKTLYERKYISHTELQADELAVTRGKNKLQLAENNLELLQNFTYHRNMAQLESDFRQAEMALERTKRKARADVIQAKADLKAKDLEYQRHQDKLKKIADQLEKTKIYAPQDGMVVYATTSGRRSPFDRREPLDIGVEVFERQDLIRLPTAASMKAEVDIHETSLQKVQVGLPAVITVDALPGKEFLGRVGVIAPLPDARSMWMNPDLKIYPTDIYLQDNDSALRTGMSCKAEIIVEQYEDVVHVPVQAVLRVGGKPTVFVVDGKTFEQREVEIGLDNNRMVCIVSGLREGEVVLMTPPLESGAVEPAYAAAGAETSDSRDTSNVMRQRINESLEEADGARMETPSIFPDDSADRQPRRPRTSAGPGGGGEERDPDQGRGGRGGFPGMSQEEREKMRQRFEKMSPEERQKEIEKMRQRFQNLSPEERQRMQERSQGGAPAPGARAREQGSERNQ